MGRLEGKIVLITGAGRVSDESRYVTETQLKVDAGVTLR
jgi:hypothetical protein